jgi:hypothetical protein
MLGALGDGSFSREDAKALRRRVGSRGGAEDAEVSRFDAGQARIIGVIYYVIPAQGRDDGGKNYADTARNLHRSRPRYFLDQSKRDRAHLRGR